MKNLREISFSDLPEGAYSYISPTNLGVDFVNNKIDRKAEIAVRKEKHHLVQVANKMNKDAKRRRKQNRFVDTESGFIYTDDMDFKESTISCDIFFRSSLMPKEIETLDGLDCFIFDARLDCYKSRRYMNETKHERHFERKPGHYYEDMDFFDAVCNEDIYVFECSDRFNKIEVNALEQAGFFNNGWQWKHQLRFSNRVNRMLQETADVKSTGIFSEYLTMFRDLFSKVPGFDTYSNVADDLINTIGLLYLLYRERKVSSRVIIFHLYLGAMHTDFSAKVVGSSLFALADNIINNFIFSTEELVETESFSDHLSSLSFMLKSVIGSTLVASVRNLVVSIAALKFLDKDLALQVYKHFGPCPTSNVGDLVTLIIDSLAALFRVGEGLLAGVPLSELLFTTDPVSAAIIEGRRLLAMQDMLYTGLPVDGKMCQKEFVVQGTKVIKLLEIVIKKSNPLKSGYKAVAEVFGKLGPLVNEVKLRIKGSDRQPPFCIVLHGDPGIGKSTLMNFIYRIHSEVKNRRFDPNQIFSRINSSDFWEGYDGYSHPYIHYSELGNTARSMVKTKGDPTLSELTSVIDSVSMSLNMAGMEGKGKVYFIGELIIIDTNNPGMNLDLLFSNPAAFKRRFVYVNPTVIPDLRKDNSTGLDINKTGDRRLNDNYKIDVYREVENGNKNSSRKFMLEGGDIDDLHDVLYDFFEKRIAEESMLLDKKRADVDVKYGRKRHDIPLDTMKNSDMNLEYDSDLDDVETEAARPSVYSDDYDDSINCDSPEADLEPDISDSLPRRDDDTSKGEEEFDKNFRFLNSFFASMFFFRMKLWYVLSLGSMVEIFFECFHYCMLAVWPMYRYSYLLIVTAVKAITVQVIGDTCMEIIMTDFGRHCSNVWNFISSVSLMTMDVGISQFDYTCLEVGNYFWPHRGQEIIRPWMYGFMFISSYLFLQYTTWSVNGAFFMFFYGYICIRMIPIIGDHMQKQKIDRARNKRNFHLAALKNYFENDMSTVLVASKHYEIYIFYALTGTVLVGAIYKLFIMKSNPLTEDFTEFHKPSASNDKLNAMEEEMMCSPSTIRTKGKNPEVWSVQSCRQDFSHTGDSLSLYASVNSNARLAYINDTSWTTIFGICQDFAVVNTHALPKEGEFMLRVSMTGSRLDTGQFKNCLITPKNRKDLGNDVSVVRLSQMQFKDIRKHLSDNDFTRTTGCVLGQKTVMKCVPAIIANNPIHGNIKVINAIEYKLPGHSKGQCGSPVVIDFAGRAFVKGFHFAGAVGSEVAYATPLPASLIKSAIDVTSTESLMMPIVSQSEEVVALEPPKPKSTFLHVNLHNVDYIGYDGNPVMLNNNSKLRKSILHAELPVLFFDKLGFVPKTRFASPMMRPGYVDESYVSPFNVNLIKINTEKFALNKDKLEDCVAHYVKRVLRLLEEKGITQISPLTLDEAINGANQDAYLRRINASTGAGYGFKGKKDKFIPIVHEDEEKITREPTEELKLRLLERMEDFQIDQSKGTIFGAKLKDEPREFAKARAGRTRMFYPAPIDSLILARQVLAPLFTLMVQFNDIFMTSVGINMHLEGENLFKKMEAFANTEECVFDGDYKEYDTSMPFEIGLAASSILYRLAEIMGYSPAALKQLKGVLSDNLFPVVELLGDIFIAAGLMTSGSYGTAEFNCIRNILLMMYYFRDHPDLTLEDFDNEFFKTTYGDDVTGVVKEKIQNFFNNVLYAEYCKNTFGMTFTTPDKNESTVALRRLKDFSFLKRNFTVHPVFKNVKATLEMESIYKMLYWVIPSDSVSQLDQLSGTCSASLWELFLHLDKDSFNEFRSELIRLVNGRIENAFDENTLPTWERICNTLQPDAIELKVEEVHNHPLLFNSDAHAVEGFEGEGDLQW